MKQKENKSIFLDCLGDTPQLRVLDFLIDNQFFDYPITEIARESNVSYNSLKMFLEKFIESKILIRTRKVGKSDYYKLNIENPFIKNLIKLDWMLVKSNSGLCEVSKKARVPA
jgi:predicted transcriptional regulator